MRRGPDAGDAIVGWNNVQVGLYVNRRRFQIGISVENIADGQYSFLADSAEVRQIGHLSVKIQKKNLVLLR